MIDYLNSIKEISDKLVAVHESLSESDLVAYILAGLSNDYESFIDSTETRTESVATDELHSLLVSKEISLQKRKTRASASSSSMHFLAYTAQSHGKSGSNNSKGNFQGRYQNHNRFNQNRNSHNNNYGTNRFNNNYGVYQSGNILGAYPSSSGG